MMSTSSLPAVRSALGLQSFPPQVAAVRQARRFVETTVAASTLPGVGMLADDAGLLVSELAANAVLHARSDFTVAVYEIAGGVRISVRDSSQALPVLVAPSATAMSGRGLALVQTLARQWGAGASTADGAVKSVWFELAADRATTVRTDDEVAGEAQSPAGTDLSVEELLAAWGEDAGADLQTLTASPATASTAEISIAEVSIAEVSMAKDLHRVRPRALHVVLPPLDAASLLAAKEAMDDVLRELQLVLLDRRQHGPATAQELSIAAGLDEAARGFDDVRRQVRHQVSRAVATGKAQVAVELTLLGGTAGRALAYRSAVHAAEALAAGGALLSSVESLRAHHAVREAYLGEVIAAAEQLPSAEGGR